MRILFLLLDFVIFLIIALIVLATRSSSYNVSFFIANCFVLIPAFLIITLVLLIFSFYDFKILHKKQIEYSNLAIAFVFTFLFSSTVIYFLAPIFKVVTPKTNLILIFIIYYLYIIISRRLYVVIIKKQINVVLIGKNRTLARLKKELLNSPYYKIIASFDRHCDDVPKDTELVIVSNSLLSNDTHLLTTVFEKFLIKNIEVKTDFIFFEDFLHRTPIEGIKDSIWLFQGITTNTINYIIYSVIKRTVDILTSLILLVIFLPIMFLIYILIKIIDKNSPIFSQERVGKMGIPIYIYKFRTMVPTTEKITKLGKILRNFRLDEIPQLINILKADISFVGPRPIWNKEHQFINKHIANNPVRTMVTPGLTGHAQLNHKAPVVYCVQDKSFFENKNSDIVFDDAYKRLSYDIWYIKNRSIFLDLEIILKTAKRMFIKDTVLK
ncbi:MAG: sugar transferase [Endomicrobiaceae bacterium]|nr:sugar transferase [Endomicrobiaceae bacterium]